MSMWRAATTREPIGRLGRSCRGVWRGTNVHALSRAKYHANAAQTCARSMHVVLVTRGVRHMGTCKLQQRLPVRQRRTLGDLEMESVQTRRVGPRVLLCLLVSMMTGRVVLTSDVCLSV